MNAPEIDRDTESDSPDEIRIFVGADRSQQLAIAVLEHSIRRHTRARVRVTPMVDMAVPRPRDPRNGQRTGFSFSRFCIPRLAGHRGKAIYMDADMLVFRDIEELWRLPFDGAKVVIQQEVKFEHETLAKAGAPARRRKQCAVMLLDCGRLDWSIDDIVAAMDRGEFGYEGLMHELCILDESEIRYGVPFEWNSLEHWDPQTRLLHYTDVGTQPWTSTANPLAELWFREVRLMLEDGSLHEATIRAEIEAGFFRPSLMRDIRYRHRLPAWLIPAWNRVNARLDRRAGYAPHKAVYAAKQARQKLIARAPEASDPMVAKRAAADARSPARPAAPAEPARMGQVRR